MKFTFAIKNLSNSVGGAERVLNIICNFLVSRNHQVTVITFDSADAPTFYKFDSRVRLLRLGIGNSERPAKPIELLFRMRALRKVILREGPHLAIGFMHSTFIPLAFALVNTDIPVLGSEHVVPEHYKSRRIQFILFLLAAPLMRKISVVSESIKRSYPESISKRMVVLPNPVLVSSSATSSRHSRKKNFTLLSVGRLDFEKNHEILIKSFARIAHEYVAWNLRIVGEGPLRLHLQNLVDLFGLQSRVVFVGVTTNIESEYKDADIFVIPSRYEAFGLVTAEAMLHGLPAVGFADCSGTNELIQNGLTGILVDAKNDRTGALSLALTRLICDVTLREKFGQAGKKLGREKFSVSSVCEKWENLLVLMGEASKKA
jgi:glycosyltransferase involved in cell wall biosynthesis